MIVNKNKVQRIMRELGLQGLIKKRNLSKAKACDNKHPYLLKDIEIVRPNQVWMIDITYMKLHGKTFYLVAIIDVFSRKIIAYNISTSLTVEPSLWALEEGIFIHGAPDISNSDQGTQYTSEQWIKRLQESAIKISMDGKGRWADNIYIERFWNSIKYECIYWHDITSIDELKRIVDEYIKFYNQERPHQALAYMTPDEVFFEYQKLTVRSKNALAINPLESICVAKEKNLTNFVNQWS